MHVRDGWVSLLVVAAAPCGGGGGGSYDPQFDDRCKPYMLEKYVLAYARNKLV